MRLVVLAVLGVAAVASAQGMLPSQSTTQVIGPVEIQVPDGGLEVAPHAVTIIGTVPVSGNVGVTGPVAISGTVQVTADAGLPVFGTVNVGNTVPVSGAVTISEPVTLTVPDGGLQVYGPVTVTSMPAVSGSVAVTNLPAVSGTVAVSSLPSVTVTSLPSVTGTVAVSSIPAVTGTVAVSSLPSVVVSTMPRVDVNVVNAYLPVAADALGTRLTVDVGNTPAVTVSGTPTVALQAGSTVALASASLSSITAATAERVCTYGTPLVVAALTTTPSAQPATAQTGRTEITLTNLQTDSRELLCRVSGTPSATNAIVTKAGVSVKLSVTDAQPVNCACSTSTCRISLQEASCTHP